MKMKRLAASAAALTMIASMAAVPLSASAYAPINGGDVTFEKYLVMKNEASVPNVTFELIVEPISDAEVKPATDDTLAVMKGPEGIKFKSGVSDVTVSDPVAASGTTPAKPATASVAFKVNDTTHAEADKGSKSIVFKTTSTTDEKFAEKKVTLDLSGVSFPEPGVYRYKITETSSSGVAGITNDTNNVRYLDVYVKSETTNTGETASDTLAVQGYFIHSDDTAPTAGVTADSTGKSTGFSNLYDTNDLEFRKVVTGNHGSKDKYFKITVRLTNSDNLKIADNDTFILTGNWDKTPSKTHSTIYDADTMKGDSTHTGGGNNRGSVTYGDLKGEGYSFYIHDGQLIEIHGIPTGLGYVVTEVEEDYNPSVAMNTDGDVKTDDKTGEGTAIDTTVKNSVTDTYLKDDAGVVFTNDNAGNLPTGLLSTVAGAAGLVVLGAAGVVGGTIYVKKKRSEEE